MTEERIPTTEKLAHALQEAGAPPQMIQRARTGYYDDYKSKHATPITLLASDARFNKLPDIAKRAEAGEFDAQDWEAGEWAESPDGKATFA
jgi:hypothetical protein